MSLRRVSLALAAAALAALMSVGPPSFAGSSHAKAGKRCPDGRLCVWTKAGYRGERVLIKKRALSNKLHNKIPDDASSLKLRKSGTGLLFEDTDGDGLAICVFQSQPNIPDLSDYEGFDFDNTASSSRITKEAVAC